jgi:DNA-binding NarL/FixJ family response regulator
LAYKEIAVELGITLATVKTHLGRVFVKTKTLSSLAAIYQLRLRMGDGRWKLGDRDSPKAEILKR